MRLPRASRYVASNLLVPVDLKYCSSALSVGAFVPCWAWKNDNIRLFVFVFVFVFPATGDSKGTGRSFNGEIGFDTTRRCAYGVRMHHFRNGASWQHGFQV